MKKLFPLIATCLLLMTGFATPASTTSFTGLVISGEPEPHLNSIYLLAQIYTTIAVVYLLKPSSSHISFVLRKVIHYSTLNT